MSVPFNAQQGPILVEAFLEGPTATVKLLLIVDSGSTRTLIHTPRLVLAGHDPSQAVLHEQIVTASQIETCPVVFTKRFLALGQQRTGVSVLGHTLPAAAGVDGVLGLDFFRGLTLTLDFRKGEIELV